MASGIILDYDMQPSKVKKRSLLDDFIKIYNSINCDSEYCSCNECSNKYICEIVGNILNSMRNHYYKTTRN